MVKETAVHYHANFAVYVDGQRLPMLGPTFYEEVTACGNDGPNNPRTRVHMHNNVNYVVHVHDSAATWGHFFANLRYGLTDSSLTLDDRTLISNTDSKKLSFWLNGKEVENIANKTIASEDTLLVSYDVYDEERIKKQYESIIRDAGSYNQKADPSACSGSGPLTFSERIKRAFTVNPPAH